jgi:MFS family permease
MEPDRNSSVALTPAWHSIGARAFPAPAWHYGKTSTPQGIPNTDGIDYSQRRAVVVVEGATLATFVTGTITMLIIGVLLNIVGLGIFCWALFALATHALPFFVGMTVGIYSFQVGAGPFGAIVVGFVAGSTTLVAGQFAYSVVRSPKVRLVVGSLFALPAACAGYDVTLAFAHIGVPSEWWREAFAVVGAITVGGAAWGRMSIVRNPAPRELVLRRSTSAAHGGSGHEQVTLRLHRLFVWDRRGNRSSA